MKSCPHLKAEERRKETLSQPPPFKRRPATGHRSRDSPRIPKGSRAAAPRPKRRPGEGCSLAEKRAGGEGHRRDRRTGTASRWRGGSLRPLGRGARLLTRFCRRPGGERPLGPGGPHRAGRFSQASACRSTGTPAAPFRGCPGTARACLAWPAGHTHRQPRGQKRRLYRTLLRSWGRWGAAPTTRARLGSSYGGRVLYFCCSSGNLSKGKT